MSLRTLNILNRPSRHRRKPHLAAASTAQPVATAIPTSKVGLSQFNQPTHDDGREKCEQKQLARIFLSMPTKILPPDNGAQHAIHHEMCPLVHHRHVAQRHILRNGHQADDPDGHHQEARHGIPLHKGLQITHLFFFLFSTTMSLKIEGRWRQQPSVGTEDDVHEIPIFKAEALQERGAVVDGFQLQGNPACSQ